MSNPTNRNDGTDSERCRLFQAICDNASMAFLVLDSRRHCVYMNPAAQRLTGYTLAELRQRNLQDLVHPSYRNGMSAPVARDAIGGWPQVGHDHGENILVHRDGSFYPVAYATTPISEPGIGSGTIMELRDLGTGERSRWLQLAQKAAFELAVGGAPVATILDLLARTGAEQLSCRTAIFLMEAGGAYLRFGAAAGTSGDPFCTSPQFPSCGRAARTGERVVTDDVTRDAMWASYLDLAREHEVRACWSTPIRSLGGDVLGTFATYHRDTRRPEPHDMEVTDILAHTIALVLDRHKTEEDRRQNEAWQRLILESAEEYAIFTIGLGGEVTSWNAGAQRLLGYTAQEILGRPSDILFTALDRETGRRAEEMRLARVEGRANNDRWHQRKDGTCFWASGLMMPLKDPVLGVQGYLKILRDHTAEHHDDERRALLINELNHRVKNTLATVQSIVGQGLRSIVGGGDIRNVIEARLLALSRSHDLLTRENWESADLRQVALHALEPFADRHGSLMQFTIEGPDVRLSPKMALALGMAFHELGTNATKYGALRHDGGRIDLSWLLVGATGSDLVRLLWRERGGPEVQAPLRKGFGSRLLEERLAQELDGEVGLDYRVEGLICRIDMPAPKPRGAQYAQ